MATAEQIEPLFGPLVVGVVHHHQITFGSGEEAL